MISMAEAGAHIHSPLNKHDFGYNTVRGKKAMMEDEGTLRAGAA